MSLREQSEAGPCNAVPDQFNSSFNATHHLVDSIAPLSVSVTILQWQLEARRHHERQSMVYTMVLYLKRSHRYIHLTYTRPLSPAPLPHKKFIDHFSPTATESCIATPTPARLLQSAISRARRTAHQRVVGEDLMLSREAMSGTCHQQLGVCL